jgi:hypothetical protein
MWRYRRAFRFGYGSPVCCGEIGYCLGLGGIIDRTCAHFEVTGDHPTILSVGDY